MTISEYDGPTAWADMTAVEKMEAWLCGDVAECDEREVFKQAIREARSETAVMTAISAALRESQAEVARLRAALVEAREDALVVANRFRFNESARRVVDTLTDALEPTR